ncbi:MAG: hypothetical protein AAGG51_05575 [Cyanobacteria bacterium P01_G01_bin.54]
MQNADSTLIDPVNRGGQDVLRLPFDSAQDKRSATTRATGFLKERTVAQASRLPPILRNMDFANSIRCCDPTQLGGNPQQISETPDMVGIAQPTRTLNPEL